jgi:hypothetical protein
MSARYPIDYKLVRFAGWAELRLSAGVLSCQSVLVDRAIGMSMDYARLIENSMFRRCTPRKEVALGR